MSLMTALRTFLQNKRGNVLIIFAFAVIPLTFATAMAVDYSRAARLQTKLNALADAAALSAVTKTMMNQSDSDARDVAEATFNAQAEEIEGLTNLNPTVVINRPNGLGSREAVVSYWADSVNAFGGILGRPFIRISGSSTSANQNAPDIDFYMLLDTSPSMLLPATTNGLATLTKATGGCAFACHQTNVKPGAPEVICKNGKCLDYYGVARENNIVLRTDLLHEAVEDLTDTATKYAAQNKATYRMGLFSFDKTFGQVWPPKKSNSDNVDADLSRVRSHVSDAQTLVYCQNNFITCGVNDNDTGTNFTVAFNGINSTMPFPGNGTKKPSDSPQEVMFLISDGMRDEDNSGRKLGPIPTAMCDVIKSRGIRIAVLYTEYLPESASDDWSKKNVKTPFLDPTDKISPPMKSCASPGLYSKVTTNSDISTALANLFEAAVATARLTK